MTDELDLIKDVASLLSESGIEYMLTGSMAMAVYATPRMTRDIDVIIQVSTEDTSKIDGQENSESKVGWKSARQ